MHEHGGCGYPLGLGMDVPNGYEYLIRLGVYVQGGREYIHGLGLIYPVFMIA